MGVGQNKTTLTAANGLENAAAALCECVCMMQCACVCLYHISAEREERRGGREGEQERQPVANVFPVGPSLTATQSKKKWGATGEQPLENIRLHLLTRLWKQLCIFPYKRNKIVTVMI